jgi:hypothetical protein
MILPASWSQVLDFFGTPLVIAPSPGPLLLTAHGVEGKKRQECANTIT